MSARAELEGTHLAIRAPNWVGDLVMATPVLRAAASDPRPARVSILVREHLADILSGDELEPHLVRVGRGLTEREAYAELQPDSVLLLSNSPGSALRAWLARVPVRAGAALAGRGPLLTHRVVPPSRGGRRVAIPTAHLLADVAGLVDLSPAELHPVLEVDRPSAERAREILRELRLEEFVVCCPGAAFGAAKLWPIERFAAALTEIHRERGWPVLLLGAPGERPLLEGLEQLLPDIAHLPPAGSATLAISKALVRESRLVLVGDSGPRWIAAAFDIPCVSVMGPNFPELTATSLERCEIVRRDDLECAPCLERSCPLGHHRCLNDLPVETVLAAVRRVLSPARVG